MSYWCYLQHVVSYSISQGDIINVVTFDSDPKKYGDSYEGEWVSECLQEELLECYSGWEPEVEQLLKVREHHRIQYLALDFSIYSASSVLLDGQYTIFCLYLFTIKTEWS